MGLDSPSTENAVQRWPMKHLSVASPEASKRGKRSRRSAIKRQALGHGRQARSDAATETRWTKPAWAGGRAHPIPSGQPRMLLAGVCLGSGGESGIRTHGTLSRTHAFQACALNHSAISPAGTVPSHNRPFPQLPPPHGTADGADTRLRRRSSAPPGRRSAGFRPCRTAASASCPPSASPAASACG